MAVDNFVAFKKLMIRRNAELNEEALKMMLQKEQKQIHLQLAESVQTPKTEQSGIITTPEGAKIYQSVGKRWVFSLLDVEELRREQEEYALALQVSMAQEEMRKQEEMEEDEMMKRVMEMSIKEEEERKANEEKKIDKQLKKAKKESIQEA